VAENLKKPGIPKNEARLFVLIGAKKKSRKVTESH
jgi:hypothetical protein